MSPIRVLLADDHTLVRAGIRSLLESVTGLEVVAECGDGRECLELVGRDQHRVEDDVAHLMVLQSPGDGPDQFRRKEHADLHRVCSNIREYGIHLLPHEFGWDGMNAGHTQGILGR